MEHELGGLLDGVDEPVTVEELEGVVRRAGQRQRATLIAGAAGLLLGGAVAGALARGPVDSRPAGFAAPPQGAKPPAPLADVTMSFGGVSGVKLTPLFRREANGVAMRAYRSSFEVKGASACVPPDTMHGELSNGAAVSFAMAPLPSGESFTLLAAGHFGQEEGEPVTWATVRAGTGVTTVRFGLAGATDTMAPQNGLALLAVPGDGGDGVVDGLDAEGKVVATLKLSQLSPPLPPIDPACIPDECISGVDEAGPPPPDTPPPHPPVTPAQVPAPVAPDSSSVDPTWPEVTSQANQDASAQERSIRGHRRCDAMPVPPAPAPVTTVPGQDPANVTVPVGPSTAPTTTMAPPMTPMPPPSSPAATATSTTSTTVKAP